MKILTKNDLEQSYRLI